MHHPDPSTSSSLVRSRMRRKRANSLAVQQLEDIQHDGEEKLAMPPPQLKSSCLASCTSSAGHAGGGNLVGSPHSPRNSPQLNLSRRGVPPPPPSTESTERGAEGSATTTSRPLSEPKPPPALRIALPPSFGEASVAESEDASTDNESVIIDIEHHRVLHSNCATRPDASSVAADPPGTPGGAAPPGTPGGTAALAAGTLIPEANSLAAPKALAEFIERHGLPADAAVELTNLFQKTVHEVPYP